MTTTILFIISVFILGFYDDLEEVVITIATSVRSFFKTHENYRKVK